MFRRQRFSAFILIALLRLFARGYSDKVKIVNARRGIMSTHIELQLKTAERLTALAKAKGLSIDDLLRALLGEWEAPHQGIAEPSLVEFERDMDALGEGLEHLPVEYRGT